MTFETSSLIPVTAILALVPTAQASAPVTLDGGQLKQLSAGALPDIVGWDIDGGTRPGLPLDASAVAIGRAAWRAVPRNRDSSCF